MREPQLWTLMTSQVPYTYLRWIFGDRACSAGPAQRRMGDGGCSERLIGRARHLDVARPGQYYSRRPRAGPRPEQVWAGCWTVGERRSVDDRARGTEIGRSHV